MDANASLSGHKIDKIASTTIREGTLTADIGEKFWSLMDIFVANGYFLFVMQICI